ncbi:protein preY, mitochondrial [Lampetra fluviatilis]
MSASHFARLRILQNFSSIISRSSNIISRSNSSIISRSNSSISSRGRSVPVPRRPHSQLAAPDLALLVCPLSRLPLRLDESGSQLVNDELGLVFPVVEGIPYLTAEDARKITEADSDSDSAAKSGADRPAASEPGAAEPR